MERHDHFSAFALKFIPYPPASPGRLRAAALPGRQLSASWNTSTNPDLSMCSARQGGRGGQSWGRLSRLTPVNRGTVILICRPDPFAGPLRRNELYQSDSQRPPAGRAAAVPCRRGRRSCRLTGVSVDFPVFFKYFSSQRMWASALPGRRPSRLRVDNPRAAALTARRGRRALRRKGTAVRLGERPAHGVGANSGVVETFRRTRIFPFAP